jgi:hypothetical protein
MALRRSALDVETFESGGAEAQLGIHRLWLSRAAALDYSALETAVVMLAVRLADGWNSDDATEGGWIHGMAGG